MPVEVRELIIRAFQSQPVKGGVDYKPQDEQDKVREQQQVVNSMFQRLKKEKER